MTLNGALNTFNGTTDSSDKLEVKVYSGTGKCAEGYQQWCNLRKHPEYYDNETWAKFTYAAASLYCVVPSLEEV